MLQWKKSQLAVRRDTTNDGILFNPILHGGKLTQQWIVDSHLQVEANNLNFVKNNQSKLRVEEYQGLMDHISNAALAKTYSFYD